jgi:hypothetical protein
MSASRNKPQFRKDLPQGEFVDQGVNLALPIDRIPPGQYAILRNVREYSTGEIRTRPGVTATNAIAIPDANIHTGKQLNDSTGAFPFAAAIILGAGANLYLAPISGGLVGPPSHIDSSYSGSPLMLNPFRPNQAPNPWVYVGDSTRNTKLRIDGKIFRQGIIPPNAPPTGVGSNPTPTISQFQFVTLDSGIGDAAFWTTDGTVFTTTGNLSGGSDTIAAFLPEGTLPGFANVAVTAPTGNEYQAGRMIFVGAETVIVDSAYPAMAHPTTLASIAYDGGTTGPATITLSNVRPNVVQNSILQFTSTGEYVRIESVSLGKDGSTPSFRVTVANTYTAGSAVTGVFSWRAAFTGIHNAGNSYTFEAIAASTAVLPSIAPGATVIGNVTRNVSIDASNIGGRPIQPTDVLNVAVSLPLSVFIAVPEVQFQFILGGDVTQYYLVTIRPSDFTPLVASTLLGGGGPITSVLSLQQRKITRDAISATPLTPDTTASLTIQKLSTQLTQFQLAGQSRSAARITGRLGRMGALAVGAGTIGSGPGDTGGPISGGPVGGPTHPTKIKPVGGGPGSPKGPPTGPNKPIVVGPPAPITPGAPSSTPTPVGSGGTAVVQTLIQNVTRIGSNASLTWANVTSIKVQATIQNTGTTEGELNFFTFGSMWIGGTYGPSTSSGSGSGSVTTTPIQYRIGFRSSLTGARSPAGPATRNGVSPQNSLIQITTPLSTDAQVDTCDVFRFGGTLTSWYYAGSVAAGAIFNDSQPDLEILSNPLMPTNINTPWPVFDIPRSGTCNVAGAVVTAVIGTFNTAWEQGGEILINGISQIIYRVVSSSMLEITNNAGNILATNYSLPDPILIGQPLPVIWGPFGTGQFGTVMFACGSAVEPNVVFWTNPDDPDSASDTNRNELSDPSDPLMNGFVYNGRAGVFSTKKLFLLNEAFDPISNFQYFTSDEVPNSKGLWARWAMAQTPYGIAFLAADGLYITDGSGAPTSISAALYPLFPHDGIAGTQVGPYAPVDMTQVTKLRLSFIDGRLEFYYRDANNAAHVWIGKGLDTGAIIWESNDDYTPAMNVSFPAEGQSVHARYLCGTDGRLYQSTPTPSDSNAAGTLAAINGQIRTRADDLGDSRVLKKWGDILLDYLSNNVPITVTAGFDLYTTLVTPTPATPSNFARFPLTVLDLASGNGVISRDVTLDLVWASNIATAFFYEWQPSYTVKDDSTFLRATDFDNLGAMEPKFVQGIRIWADTGGVARTVVVQGDNGPNGQMVSQSITINPDHNGECIIAYPNAAAGWTPFIAHMVRLLPTDSGSWDLLDYSWIYEEAPEAATEFATQLTTHGLDDFGWLREFNIAHFSPANIVLTTTYDDGTSSTYTILASGSVATYRKSYFPAATKKWKAVRYTATSTQPFCLVLKDTVAKVNGWGGGGPLQPVHPFGSGNAQGARV